MNLRTSTDIGLAIRERRRALGLDQATLARRLNVSRQWIIALERGRDRAPVGLVLRTLSALGLHLRAGEEPAAAPRPLPLASVDINAWVDAHRGRPRR